MLDSELPLSTPIVDQNILDEIPVITYTNMLPIESLIYDDTIDTSTIQNVILIDSTVIDFQLYNNVNTFQIVYSRMSTQEQLLEILTSKFQNISRIAIIGHFTETPYFLNNEMLFSEDPVNTNTNTQFIIDLIKQFNVSHLDFLACGTLQSQKWTNYYTQLHNATGIPIGASSDNTGNLKYGGDWVLESTQEDIHLIYFNEQIQNYSLLLTSITYDNLSYTITSGNNVSVAANQDTTISGVITIPNTFDLNSTTYIVTSITDYAFQNCSLITNIYIPSSVTTIGNNVFDGCTLLENITIDSARPNNPPVLNYINTIGLDNIYEDASNVEISFLQLYLDASYNDDDNYVNAFIVTDPGSNGTLKIGSEIYDSSTNKTITTSTSAYWTPSENANGILTAFRVAARNQLLSQSIKHVDVGVNVIPRNDNPTVLIPHIADQLAYINVFFSYTIPPNTFYDIDINDSLTYSIIIISGVNNWLDIDASLGNLSGTPQMIDIGILNIKIRATDSGGLLFAETDPFNITITVIGINDPPELSGDISGNVWEDGSLNAQGILTAVDVDLSGNFRWDISGNSTSNYGKMSISSVTNTCTWSYDLYNNSAFVQTLSQGQQITDEFYIRVRDDLSANATQLITITITGKNDPVRLLNKIPNQSIDMSSNFSYVIPSTTFLDESDNLIYSVVLSSNTSIPSWLHFESSTRTFTSVSNRTTVGPLTIKVTATDGYTSSSAYFILNVISQQAISGSVLDGYIQGGTITVRDLSTNNVVGGPLLSDQSGKFSIPLILLPSTSYIIDCSGGTDMATGAPILYPLSSIYTSGSSSNVMLNSSNVVINPLTTIVSDIVQSNISLYMNNISDVYTHVANAFGLQPSDIGSDYIYSHNIAVGIAAIKIVTITKILAVSTGTDINTIKSLIATNISDQTGKLLFDASFISDTGFGGSSSILKSNLTGIVAAISTLMDTVLNFGSSVDINRITNQYKELYKLSKGALSISFLNINTIIMSNISNTISNAAITQSVGQIMQDNLLVANICFIKGTNVVTDQGIIEIQNISLANTINGKKILMTTKTRNVDDYMVLIKKDTLAKNVPNEDTWLTGEHCVLYNRKMEKSKNLVNGTSVQKVNMEQQEVYNLLLEGLNAGEMTANGMIAETLDPKSIFVKILTVVKSKNFSPEEEMACIRDLNIDLKKAHEKKMIQMKEKEIKKKV